MAGEARFGILIEGKDQASPAIQSALRSQQELTASVERLTLATNRTSEASRAAVSSATARASASTAAAKAIGEHATKEQALQGAVNGAAQALSARAGIVGQAVQGMGVLGSAAGLAAVAMAALGGAILASAHGIGDYQEKMDLAAASTGLTTGQIAGLTVAASESGRSFEQIRPALDFFTRKIGEVAAGNSEAVKQFYDLGIAVRDTNGAIRPTGEIFKDAQAKLSSMGTAAERSAAAMDLFGRSGAASISVLLTPLDEAEAKARKLGLALGPDAERVARQADASFDMLSTSVQGIGNAFGVTAATILGEFLPALAKAASQTAEFINMKKSDDWLGNVGRGLAYVATGGSPQAFSSAVAGVMPSATQGAPHQWSVPEGNRPWGAGPGAVTKPEDAEAIAKALKEAADAAKALAEVEKIKSAQYWRAEDAINAPVGFKFRTGAPTGDFVGAGGRVGPPDDLTEGALKDFVKKDKESQDRLNKAADEQARIIDSMFEGMKSSFGSFVSDAIRGVGSLSDAFNSLVASVLDQVIQTGVSLLLGGLQSGGTVKAMQSGGIVHAQSGVIASGVRGMDTNLIAAGRGETMIVDHTTTDGLKLLIQPMMEFFGRSGGQRAPDIYNINLGVQTNSDLRDPMAIRDLAERLHFELGRVRRYGTARRAA